MDKNAEMEKNKEGGEIENGQAGEEDKGRNLKVERKPESQQESQMPKNDDNQPSKEQERFLADLICETQHFLSLQNISGKHEPPEDLRRDIQPLIDERDQFTPDHWIPRSSHLTRLTGSHPLNAEPDLTELFDAGLITPSHLHYVRNHAAVPKLDWDSHKLQIVDPEELCTNPQEFSMNKIAEMDWICIPVTLACDGNRRGEVNRVHRSAGFDWGACHLDS